MSGCYTPHSQVSGNGGSPDADPVTNLPSHGVFYIPYGSYSDDDVLLVSDGMPGSVGYADSRCLEATIINGSSYLYGTSSGADGPQWGGVYQLIDSNTAQPPNGTGAESDGPTPTPDPYAYYYYAPSPAPADNSTSYTLPLDDWASGVMSLMQPYSMVHENASSVWIATDHAR